MTRTDRGNHSSPFRRSLRFKLMLAFGIVGLIGYIAPLQVLPRLYVWSQNRDIDLANPINTALLRNHFVAIVKTRAEAFFQVKIAESAAYNLLAVPAFHEAGFSGKASLTPPEVMSWLTSRNAAAGDIEDVTNILQDLQDKFGIVRVIPWKAPPLTERISLLREAGSDRLYIPILIPLPVPESSQEWTLAVGKPKADPLQLEVEGLYEGLKVVGLTAASELFFSSAEEVREANPSVWERALEYRQKDYLEMENRAENMNQRLLFIPADSLEVQGSLVGLFCIVYERTSGLYAWQELATSGYAYLALGIAILGALLISYFVARGIGRPIQDLTRTAVAIAHGRLDQRVEVSSRDEIGVLAQTFNEMTDRLRTTLEELRKRAETIERQNEELDRRFSQLTALQNYTENVLATVDSAIFSVDLDGRIRRPNRAAQDLLGLCDGQSQEDLASEPLKERLLAALEYGETTVSDEINLISPRQEKVPSALSVSPLREGKTITGAVAVLTDLQVIKNLEMIVSRQERLAALGQLTAGVAHELRNPLSIIKACAEILHQRFSGQEGEKGLTADIIDEVDRLSRVVSEFLSFARPNQPNRSTVNLNQLIHKTLGLLEKGESDSVIFKRMLYDPLPPVEADADQVEQVLLNLVRNGLEAMHGKGTIELHTGADADERTVWFEVKDHGEGMSEEARRKIFDPFYTTKSEGTGLGLSICHRIIESHGGTIEVAGSEPGQGTVFRVTFPESDQAEEIEESTLTLGKEVSS
ncbi:MAG: Sensor protein ZraS [Candidatus Hinthialibacteria bacterium OLB16]|nr:MAG: Sensor protein ZraS [Candidatus Hinthialibacteria bacterium OLB16]